MSTDIKNKTAYLLGNLYVNDTTIEVVLDLWVSSDSYIYGKLNMIINNGHKAIIFSYYNSKDPELSDNEKMNAAVPIRFSIEKPKEWKSGDVIRVMYINECDTKSFHELTSYFETRLNKFGYHEMDDETHKKFNAGWNVLHPGNKVFDAGGETPSRLPRFTKRDGIFTLMSR